MKHQIAVIVLLGLTAGWHSFILQSHKAAAEQAPDARILDIPAHIGGYEQYGAEQETSEDVKQLLETSSILSRVYRARSGRPVQFTVVHAGTTRRSLHFPEVCLVGQGWEVREQISRPIGFLFSASGLVLVKGQRNEAILYWFMTGDRATGSFFENSWHWALAQFQRGHATSAMIRVSTPIGSDGKEAAFDLLEDFAMKVAPILTERMQ